MLSRYGRKALAVGALAFCLCFASAGAGFGDESLNAVFAGRDWQSAHFQDHELAGVIWSPRRNQRLSFEAYQAAIGSADLVLLGEVHTNPDHHLLQAEALGYVVDSGRTPAVVFEMISRDLSSRLEAALTENPRDWQGLGDALSWEARGWPSWDIYAPIARVALENGLTILPGDLSRDDIRTISRDPGNLTEDLAVITGTARPLRAASRMSLDDQLFRSHCELVPRDAIAPMRQVQIGRDAALTASLADGMNRVGRDNGAVLIAGAGHTRRDWGVPWHLAEHLPDVSVLSVAFIEVAEGMNAPADYFPETENGRGVYDIIVFTPRADVTDHCAGLRERFNTSKGVSE